jgi:phage/plasmid-like protein (TIGR03299 family)
MADMIATTNGIEHYAGRQAAWHGKGSVVLDATTMKALADAAGINFEYTLTPVFFEVETMTDTFHHQFVGQSVITKNGITPLAIVSDSYEFMQPGELVDTLDAIIVAGGWKPETALALGQGETTAWCVALGDWSITGNGGDDRVRDFLLVTDTVDGKHALQICIVTVRVVCANTLRIALRTAQVKLNLIHKTGHRINYGRAVDLIVKSQNNVREALTELSRIAYTQDKLTTLFSKVFDTTGVIEQTPQADALRKRMHTLQADAQGFAVRMVKDEGLPLSGWVAYNAVSEAVEHGGNFGGPTGVRKSLLLGNGAAMATLVRAYDMIPAIAKG